MKDYNENLGFTLPNKPFTLSLIGQRGAGKSYRIKQLLKETRKRFEKQNRFIISPTLGLDDTLTNFFYDENKFEIYNDDIVDYIVETILKERDEVDFRWHHKLQTDPDTEEQEWVEIKKRIGKKTPDKLFPEYILVVDDSIGMFKNNSKLSFLPTRHRHYKLSMIVASQNFKSLSPVLRNNTMIFIFFRTNNKEMKKIAEEFNVKDNEDEFITEFREKTDKDYGVFIVNYFRKGRDIYE